MTKLRLPIAVMADLLSVSCNRYTAGQAPALFYSRFESGRSLGIQRARVLNKSILKSRDLEKDLPKFFEEVAHQFGVDGYGEVQVEKVRFDQGLQALTLGIRLPKPLCENEERFSVDERTCGCYKWFWRGVLKGLACEIGWTVKSRHERRRLELDPLSSRESRKAWENKVCLSVNPKSLSYMVMSAQVKL
jgi:hypothetical protein